MVNFNNSLYLFHIMVFLPNSMFDMTFFSEKMKKKKEPIMLIT